MNGCFGLPVKINVDHIPCLGAPGVGSLSERLAVVAFIQNTKSKVWKHITVP